MLEPWFRVAVLVACFAISRTAYATPMNPPPDAGPYTRDLHQRGRNAAARRAHAEAAAIYEHGARTAPEASSRAMFLYEEALALIDQLRFAEAFGVIDRLVAEPAHPAFGCEAPPPNAAHLYRALAPRAAGELLRRARQHEAEGRLLEAFEEAQTAAAAWTAESQAATAFAQRLAQRLAPVVIHARPSFGGALAAQISVDGAIHGPDTRFSCLVVADPPRMLTVFARTADVRQTSASLFVRGGAAVQELELRFPDAPGAAPSKSTSADDEGRGPPGVLYLGIGLGGGYLNAAGPTSSSTSGAGHLSEVAIFLAEGRWSSTQFVSDGSIGGGSDGVQALGRLHFELGGRLPLYDDDDIKNGLFLRGGVGARAMANNAIATYTLELPTASAGYTFTSKSVIAQLGYRAGPSLVGRYSVGDAYNRQDARRLFEVSLTHGPFASLHAGPIHFDAEIARAETSRAPGTPADYVNGTACGTVFLFGLCAHTMYGRTDVTPDPGALPWARSEALYVGGSVVIALDSTGIGTGMGLFTRK